MPTRAHYLTDPEYDACCRRVFGAGPDTPCFELYIPRQYRTPDLLQAVQMPIWLLENNVIWPLMAEMLRADGVRGAFLEFGVYTGHSLRRHVEIFRPTGVITRFFGFDSFKGLPAVDAVDDVPNLWHQGQFAHTSRDGVLRTLQEALGHTDDIELVEGWFNETLPGLAVRIPKVAFVRIDCDLYRSTQDVFEFVADCLVDGAILYFDDWSHDATTGETKAFFEFADREAGRYVFERLLTVSDGALAVRVRHRP